jgi:hypothetical protein
MRRKGMQRSISETTTLSNLSITKLRPVVLRSPRSARRISRRPRLSFEQLAKHGKFRAVLRVLHDDQMDDVVLSSWLSESCSGGETALHRLLRYQPPLRLVDLLTEKLTTLEFVGTSCGPPASENDVVFIPELSRDDQGRTPLHIAAEAGCHFEVIDRLMEGTTCIMPALTKDDHGRFPLHWACTNPSGVSPCMSSKSMSMSSKSMSMSSKSMSSKSTSSPLRFLMSSSRRLISSPRKRREKPAVATTELMENMINVIRMLVKVYPEAASIPDENGHTPLHLARLSLCDVSVLEVLENAVKAIGSTTYVDPDVTPFEFFSFEVSRCGSYVDGDDDVSSLGMEEGCYTPGQHNFGKPDQHPSDIIVDPKQNDDNPEVIQQCWFI